MLGRYIILFSVSYLNLHLTRFFGKKKTLVLDLLIDFLYHKQLPMSKICASSK